MDWQGVRYRAGQREGHYESWFLRANHPQRKQAFWIRYTIFSPKGRPEDAIGELWAVYFDGESGQLCAAKSELPLKRCEFAQSGLKVQIGEATLQPGQLQGAALAPHKISWQLRYTGAGKPLLFLPENLYTAALPKAKAVTPGPFACFNGSLMVDGREIPIEDWVGSENHNWGSKHTDSYAWGQVAGFDNAPDTFLEVISARLKIGPVETPTLTIVVLRVGDEEYRLNALLRAFRAKGQWRYFDWAFEATQGDVRISGHFHAQAGDFVGLNYYNPPGGSHTCLNSKIAGCELTLERRGEATRLFRTVHRAAFEILTDDSSHGIAVVA